jgi:hypothetical protein
MRYIQQRQQLQQQQRAMYQRPLSLAERLQQAEQRPQIAYQEKVAPPQAPPQAPPVRRSVSYSKLARIAFLFSGICFLGAVALGALRMFCASRLDGGEGLELGVVMGMPVDFGDEPLISI